MRRSGHGACGGNLKKFGQMWTRLKRAPSRKPFKIGWGTRIRTLIHGVRVRCPAVERSPSMIVFPGIFFEFRCCSKWGHYNYIVPPCQHFFILSAVGIMLRLITINPYSASVNLAIITPFPRSWLRPRRLPDKEMPVRVKDLVFSFHRARL